MGWYDDYPDNWDQIRKAVYQRDNYTCQKCGTRGGPYGDTELHAHHIVPKSQGGSHQPNNLATICWQCHNAEHDHHVPKMSEISKQSGRSRSSGSRVSPGHTPNEMDEPVKQLRNIYMSATDESDRTESLSSSGSSVNSSHTATSHKYESSRLRQIAWAVYILGLLGLVSNFSAWVAAVVVSVTLTFTLMFPIIGVDRGWVSPDTIGLIYGADTLDAVTEDSGGS